MGSLQMINGSHAGIAALEWSCASEEQIGTQDLRAVLENWICIEDDSFVAEEEVEEVVRAFENLKSIAEVNDTSTNDENEETHEDTSIFEDSATAPIDYIDAVDRLREVKLFCKQRNLGSEFETMCDRIERGMRWQMVSEKTTQPTILQFINRGDRSATRTPQDQSERPQEKRATLDV